VVGEREEVRMELGLGVRSRRRVLILGGEWWGVPGGRWRWVLLLRLCCEKAGDGWLETGVLR
jgi:hypothetical protein